MVMDRTSPSTPTTRRTDGATTGASSSASCGFERARARYGRNEMAARALRWIRFAGRHHGSALCAALTFAALSGQAQVVERFSADQRGDFALIGNTLAQ